MSWREALGPCPKCGYMIFKVFYDNSTRCGCQVKKWEPEMTLSEQVAKLEAEVNNLNEYNTARVKQIAALREELRIADAAYTKLETALKEHQTSPAFDLQERLTQSERLLKEYEVSKATWYDRFWLTCNVEFLALSGAPSVDDVFRALKALRASSDDCAKMVEENNLLRKKNHDLMEGGGAKYWHEQYKSERLWREEKHAKNCILNDELAKANQGNMYGGRSAEEWHGKYIEMINSRDAANTQYFALRDKIKELV